MKINGLYFRMLIAFVLVQALAMLTMVSLVKMGKIRPPFTHHAIERTTAAKRLVERELIGAETLTPQLKTNLNSMLQVFASAFNGQAWITDTQGNIVSSSSMLHEPLTGDEVIDHEEQTKSGDTLYLLQRDKHKNIYIIGTVPFRNTPLTLHILHSWQKKKEEVWFIEGLLLMSSIAALLLIPVSRRLSRPLKKLSQSAHLVASGDFSPRVNVKHGGELSVLADSFNHMAESVERMVRGSQELTANLSHELRSPLARIRISQQIIHERVESGRLDGIEKHVDKMESEINHMDGLIDKILRLSKLDLQGPSPIDDLVPVEELLTETIHRHRPLMDDKNMTVEINLSPLPALRCNREGMDIVLDNIISNAIKYGQENGSISISAKSDGKATIITVANPYPSLSKEELETVFVPFKRLGYDQVEGNGLGLAFAKKIMDEHGGTIEAESGDEQFVIRLRLP